MQQGPLPLIEALLFARDVANRLRELHEDGRVHGDVTARRILLRHSGSQLLPPDRVDPYASQTNDVIAFGSLFYQMLTSRVPATETLLATPLQAPPRNGPGAVQSAAVRLAERCLTATPDNGPGMQKVLTELRLLSVRVRQFEAGDDQAPAASRSLGFPAEPAEADPAEVHPAEHSSGQASVPSAESDEDFLADGHCPRCRCSKVRVSRPRNRLERFLRAIGLPVRRCHRCYFRYIEVFKACLEMPTKKFNR